jgi:predicted HTH domain antitoxin
VEIKIDLPDDVERRLEAQWGDVRRHALETLAIEGYRARALSRAQVRRMLGLETRAEVDEFFGRRGVPFDYSVEDFEHDAEASRYLAETRARELQRR